MNTLKTERTGNRVITYDNCGNAIETRYDNGYWCNQVYDSAGREIAFINSNGYAFTKTYGDNSLVLDEGNMITQSTFDDNGYEITRHDSTGYGWMRTVDAAGHELKFEDSDGAGNFASNKGGLL